MSQPRLFPTPTAWEWTRADNRGLHARRWRGGLTIDSRAKERQRPGNREVVEPRVSPWDCPDQNTSSV